METFKELDLPRAIARNLERIKFVTPTPIQAATIPPAMEGKDVLGSAQTGTGKTAAFAIPLLTYVYDHPGKMALVLAPTRELAAQIDKVLYELTEGTDILGALLVGGEPFNKQEKALSKKPDFIVATPGRLIDHLENRKLKLDRVRILVLDEVDRMLDMGFMPQVHQIMQHVPKERQTLLFSATVPPEIERMTTRFLKDPVRITVGQTTQPISHVKEEVIETTHVRKTQLLLEQIQKRTDGRILVFASTKERADHLVRVLEREGFDVVCLHGDRRQWQRKQALNNFRSGSHRIMVATDLAGRGIDVPDIQYVINYDLPNTREDYIHRIGRAGRAGKPGIAVNFLTPGDLEGERAIMGSKPPVRKVFRSRRWR